MFGSRRYQENNPKTIVLVGLTPLGRQRADSVDTGGASEQTLIILSESGPMQSSALRKKLEQRGVRIEHNKFRLFLNQMRMRGLIKPVSPDGEYPTPC